MTVDKFGRYFENVGKKGEQEGLPLTTDGSGYDIEHKLIRNVKHPIASNDVATKGYVLQQTIKKTIDGNYDFDNKLLTNIKDPIKKDNAVTLGFMRKQCLYIGNTNNHYDAKTKVIRNLGVPTNSHDAATKDYIDKKIIANTPEGDYTFNNKLLRNIQEPKTDTDAATKGFVQKFAIKRTNEDDYDMSGKRIKNVGYPNEDSDVATKKYVTDITPAVNKDSWNFKNKRLGEVEDPIYLDDVVNLSTLNKLAITTVTKDKNYYNAHDFRICNVGTCLENDDAVNKKYVDDMTKRWTKENEQHLERMGRALYSYIHRATPRTADPNISSENYLDWDQIHRGDKQPKETLTTFLKKELSEK